MALRLEHVYAFMGGAIVHKLSGLLPTIIVSGAMLYVADPTVFSQRNIEHVKTLTMELVKNVTK